MCNVARTLSPPAEWAQSEDASLHSLNTKTREDIKKRRRQSVPLGWHWIRNAIKNLGRIFYRTLLRFFEIKSWGDFFSSETCFQTFWFILGRFRKTNSIHKSQRSRGCNTTFQKKKFTTGKEIFCLIILSLLYKMNVSVVGFSISALVLRYSDIQFICQVSA